MPATLWIHVPLYCHCILNIDSTLLHISINKNKITYNLNLQQYCHICARNKYALQMSYIICLSYSMWITRENIPIHIPHINWLPSAMWPRALNTNSNDNNKAATATAQLHVLRWLLGEITKSNEMSFENMSGASHNPKDTLFNSHFPHDIREADFAFNSSSNAIWYYPLFRSSAEKNYTVW